MGEGKQGRAVTSQVAHGDMSPYARRWYHIKCTYSMQINKKKISTGIGSLITQSETQCSVTITA